ncbi:MAG: hypothetical protein KJO17_11210 [Acidimicrobiia bacterium]|nr:hypothetical protein [Acidimicrobiia bacterium]
MRTRLLLIAVAVVAAACASTGATPVSTAGSATATPAVSTTTIAATTSAPTTTLPPTTTTTTTLPGGTVTEDARAVVMAGLPGLTLDVASEAFLADGGRVMILFAKNLSSREQVSDLTASMACAAGAPILVAVDQEPGRVDRLAKIGIPSPAVDSPTFVEDTLAMGKAMFDLGINLDLAPVLDVARGDNPVLVGRNFGPDPDVVASRGLDFQLTLGSLGIMTTAKHFPGHGLSTVDPHLQVTPIDAGLATLLATDFPPFQAAIDNGIGAIMVGHPIYAALDPDNPASLSPAVLEMLRDDFGFDGVAMTDAFSMAGVRAGGSVGDLTVQALIAGEDLLIVDNPAEVGPVVSAIEAAVAAGTLDRTRLAQAAGRVRRLAQSAFPVLCDR